LRSLSSSFAVFEMRPDPFTFPVFIAMTFSSFRVLEVLRLVCVVSCCE
jgi:hypothetical protein